MQHHNYGHMGWMREKHIPYASVEELVHPVDGDIIVDFGSGDGFYSTKFAPSVGSGKIYAYELSNKGIELIMSNISANGIKNVEVVGEDICSAELPEKFNKVFFSNVFHDLECQDDLLDRLSKVTGLEITFIEFKKDTLFGPPRSVRFSPKDLQDKLEKHGFALDKVAEFDHHYAHRYRTAGN